MNANCVRQRKFAIFLCALCALCGQARAEEDVLSEILRQGNTVQHVGDAREDADGTHAAVAALGPPESDAEKWFVTVIGSKSCKIACPALVAKWKTDPYLLAIADPASSKKSWAHFNYYQVEDKSQAFRFEKLKIDGYPTIVVQPPRTGSYGNPKTVVYQVLYGHDKDNPKQPDTPRELAEQITAAIKAYVKKRPAVQSGITRGARGGAKDGDQEAYGKHKRHPPSPGPAPAPPAPSPPPWDQPPPAPGDQPEPSPGPPPSPVPDLPDEPEPGPPPSPDVGQDPPAPADEPGPPGKTVHPANTLSMSVNNWTVILVVLFCCGAWVLSIRKVQVSEARLQATAEPLKIYDERK